jgi:hypothetical protein
MSQNDREIKNSTKITAILMVVLVILALGIFIYLIFCPCVEVEEEDGGFGDDFLNCTYSADALALTGEGTVTGRGITLLADPPTSVFTDDFEGASPWTTNDDVNEAQTTIVHWGTRSALFDRSDDGTASLAATVSIAIDADETMEIYFYVLIPAAWDGGTGGKTENDYFVLSISFEDGNTLVYEVYGTYTPGASEEVIDVSPQVTMKGIWVGINIKNIEDDYTIQFGGPTPTLPVPDVTQIAFKLSSADSSENVYLDDVDLIVEPEPFTGGAYWKLVTTGEKVTSYMIEIDYSVVIDGIVDTSVHVKWSIWVMIYDTSVAPSNLKLDLTLLQDQMIVLAPGDLSSPPPASPVVLTWDSKVFPLPVDGTVFGDDLYYVFYIMAEVWGELISSPGDWVYAMDNNDDEAFDTLHFKYVIVDGTITIIIYAVGGSIGGALIGIVGLSKRRKNQARAQVDTGRVGKESLFN